MPLVHVALAAQRIVDVARDILVEAADAQSHLVAERKINDCAYVAAVPAVIHALARRFDRTRKAPENRRRGDELQKTAFAIGAVERSLGSAQHLDALQVPGIEVAREDGAVEQCAARAER